MRVLQDSAPPSSPARERVLRTAHDLFYREGIRATGIDKVIAEAGVTKVTFYRHFPSKNDLIIEFLERRHRRWMDWFADALARHGGSLNALVPALAEWFRGGDYRGSAFINSVGELGGALPEVAKIARRHEHNMTSSLGTLLPLSDHKAQDAEALALAVNGAIVRAQTDGSPEAALQSLGRLVRALFSQP